MSERKYFKTCELPIKQYDGSEGRAPGIVEESQSIVSIAIARPGRSQFQVRPNSASQLMSRTIMFGDVAVCSFKKTGEHMEDDELIIDGEIGTVIMESKGWLIMQTKDPSTGEEREPFIRTPWDVRQAVNGNYGNLQPAVLASEIKLLGDEAMNLAAEILAGKIERNEPIRSQAEYAKAANAACKMVNIITQRSNTRQSQQTTQSQQGQLSDGAVTADDLMEGDSN